MKLGIIKNIIREELARFEKLPTWMDSFLQTINQFISNVGTALNGNLDFESNFRCTVKVISLTHGVEQEINPQNPKLRVIGVACFNANGKIIDKFGWRQLTNGNIGVTIYFDSSATSDCNIIMFLG
jgi:hypothetical protein